MLWEQKIREDMEIMKCNKPWHSYHRGRVNKYSRFDTAEKQEEYKKLDKATKRALRTDVRDQRTLITKQILENTKSIKKARNNINQGKQWTLGAKKQSGERTTSRSDIIMEATSYYKSLYTSSTPSRNILEDSQKPNDAIPPIPQSEVSSAIAELKNGKTPGEDGIWNEYMKYESELLTQPITAVFNKILQTETIPEQWKLNTIILLHKKGPKDDLSNYRPISLMSNLYKFFRK